MNLGSWIVLAIVLLVVAGAIRSIVNDRKSGKGCAGCSGCSGGVDCSGGVYGSGAESATCNARAKPVTCSVADRMLADMEKASGSFGRRS